MSLITQVVILGHDIENEGNIAFYLIFIKEALWEQVMDNC
jgi:hypothetical protein